MWELGRANLFPLVPAAKSVAPIEAAKPTQTVEISGFTYCIVSYIAMPAVTEPPGVLIYSWISFSGSFEAKNKSWAMTELATLSLMGPAKNIILSFKRRE